MRTSCSVGDVVEVPEVPEETASEVPGGTTEGPPRPPRRRGRTTLLIAVAAVLGVVAGTCTGFLVQADRAPDKLPSLSQSTLAQAKSPAPERLTGVQDRRVKTDGDLRKLLLKKPSGAWAADNILGEDGWLSLDAYAETYDKPDTAFGNLGMAQFRRAAAINWQVTSTRYVEIRLVQYRQDVDLAASDAAKNEYYWAGRESHTDQWPIPGTGDGMVYVHNSPEHKAGYLDKYQAEAHAWRGDIALEMWIDDTKPIPKKTIMDLAKRQMERL
jgi:hypothetical protein